VLFVGCVKLTAPVESADATTTASAAAVVATLFLKDMLKSSKYVLSLAKKQVHNNCFPTGDL
jgi:hypothetical protein